MGLGIGRSDLLFRAKPRGELGVLYTRKKFLL
jgi:hypothetical protein